MKSFKKRIKDEFNNYSPKLDKEILDAPILVDADSNVYQNNGTIAKRKTGVLVSIVAFLVATSFALMYAFGLFSGKGKVGAYAFTLEINPAVSFITDSYGVVTDVKALNDDADVILCSDGVQNELKNIQLSDAIVIYTDYAVQLGYIDAQDTQNAVRFSYTEQGESQIKQTAIEGLEKYFKQKGIVSVVVEEQLDLDKFAERNGVSTAGDLQTLVQELKKLPDTFGGRDINGSSIEDIKATYEQKVIGSYVFDTVKEQLIQSAERITENVSKLAKIQEKQLEIIVHKDNPYIIPVDYWTLKENYKEHFAPEFDALMRDMQKLLDEYHRDFGVLINSLQDLDKACQTYSAFMGVNVMEMLSSLKSEDFIGDTDKFLEMLQSVGYDVEGLKELTSIPETEEEYLEKSKEILNRKHEARKEEHKEAYGQEREQISDDDYRENSDKIEKEYGSLTDYFEHIKNKPKK